jgi:SAM-dependent methyltransferase
MFLQIKKTLGKSFYRGGIFYPTNNYSRVLARYKNLQGKKIINVGSGGYDPVPGAVNVDPYRGGPNTIKAFGENLPFLDESVDVVFNGGLLEHVKEPQVIINEAWRVLKVGGELYIEFPFLQPYHEAPGDYQRWTLSGMRLLCRNFKELQTGITNGPGSGIAWILVEYAQLWPKSAFFKFVFKNSMKILVAPLKYLDYFLLSRPDVSKVAGGMYFLGRKEASQKSPK